jgi:ketosteroid isomerase-like protein
MIDDERAIRELFAAWQRAAAAGDLTSLLSMMADDDTAGESFRFESRSEFGELMIHGDWAHCWCRLAVTMTPLRGGKAERRSGHTLTVLRKLSDGAWVVARDANLWAPDRAA